MSLVNFLLGVLAAVALGSSAIGRRRRLSPSRFALDLAVGLALSAPMVLVLAEIGLPIGARVLFAGELLLALGFRLFTSRRSTPGISAAPAPMVGISRFSFLVLGVSFLVAAGKWLEVPLWSWDHFAIWGTKARRIVQDGILDLGFLRLSCFQYSKTDYPVGLPLAWRALALSLPEGPFFRAAQALFGLGLVLLLRRVALKVAESRVLADILAALLCASPLYWDTEGLGLADLPLAFFAVASIALLLEARDRLAPVWVAGLEIGFLSWIKAEGALLALLLLGFGAVLLLRGRPPDAGRMASLALPPIALNSASFLVARYLLSPGDSFFWGDWRGRAASRLRHPGEIVTLLGKELLRKEWLGLWVVFALGLLTCLLTRRVLPSLLFGIVFLMLGSYSAVYFATYLDPRDHIENSFFRITAALVPLGMAAISFAMESNRRGQPPGREEFIPR